MIKRAAAEDLKFDVTIWSWVDGGRDPRLDLRSRKPFKTVNTEYLIVSWMSLVVNVAGTLGMFTGFSFIATSKWFATLVFKRLKCFQSKDHVQFFINSKSKSLTLWSGVWYPREVWSLTESDRL